MQLWFAELQVSYLYDYDRCICLIFKKQIERNVDYIQMELVLSDCMIQAWVKATENIKNIPKKLLRNVF